MQATALSHDVDLHTNDIVDVGGDHFADLDCQHHPNIDADHQRHHIEDRLDHIKRPTDAIDFTVDDGHFKLDHNDADLLLDHNPDTVAEHRPNHAPDHDASALRAYLRLRFRTVHP